MWAAMYYMKSNPWVEACEFNSACWRHLYMTAIFRYSCVYMFVRLLRLTNFKRLKRYLFIYIICIIIQRPYSVQPHFFCQQYPQLCLLIWCNEALKKRVAYTMLTTRHADLQIVRLWIVSFVKLREKNVIFFSHLLLGVLTPESNIDDDAEEALSK